MRTPVFIAVLILLLTVSTAEACHIKICKDVRDADGTNIVDKTVFEFNVNGETFLLDDNPTSRIPRCIEFSGRGIYTITEKEKDSWMLYDVECRYVHTYGMPDSSWNLNNLPTVTVNLGVDYVVCTFKNKKIQGIPEFSSIGVVIALVSSILLVYSVYSKKK